MGYNGVLMYKTNVYTENYNKSKLKLITITIKVK